MIKNTLDFTKKENEIIKKYKKIHKFIFKYSIFIVIWLISLHILTKQTHKIQNLNITDNFIIEKIKLVWTFNKSINKDINHEDIKTNILQWELEIEDDFIFSNNNLISYKDLIMPNTIFIRDLKKIKSKEFFEDKNYNIDYLEIFAKNILFINSEQTKTLSKNSISLPLDETIENTFYLKCIKNTKIINISCDYYIQNFLNTFFIYNIQQDYNGLYNIFKNLKNTKYKNNICNGVNKYMLYSNDTNQKLEKIFIACWKDYYKSFSTFQLFLDIQDQLQKWYINKTVYQNNILNNYKLISYQQIIYNDIHKNIINNIRFETYINYLQELLKKWEWIDNFYIDLSYWLNNNYLISMLNKLKYNVSDKKKLEVDNIINELNKLNNGDTLVWYLWLKDKLTNKLLVDNKQLEDNSTISLEQQNTINKLFAWIKELSFFKIISDSVVGNKVKINWYFSIKNNGWNTPIYTSLIAENIDDDLIITNIKLNWFKELDEIVWNAIKIKKYTISTIYQYIQENINIFLSDNKISTCELIWNTVNKLLQSNNKISELSIMECGPQKITILKKSDEDNVITKIYYKINLNNFNITSIMISDKAIEKDIWNYIKNIKTNNITISSIVWEILDYVPESTEYIQQWSNNIIITLEDFEAYLWTIPDDIVEWNNQIISEFTIQWIKFIWNYNITSKKIWPLYFKNNLAISNFELYLKSDNQNKINEFLIDPLKYINKTDPNTVSKYIELK